MKSVNRSFKAAVLFLLLAAALVFSSFPAYADFQSDTSFQIESFAVSPVDALGTAFVTRSALGALGVQIAGSLLDLSPEDVARAMWYGGGSTLPPNFSYALNLTEYLSRQVIRIRPDSVTIDGVSYSDVWLPHDAADKFRTNAFDFITRYNLSSESSGTFLSGVGSLCGLPVFSDGTEYVTQSYVVPAAGGSFGNVTVTLSPHTGSYYRISAVSSSPYQTFSFSSSMIPPLAFRFRSVNSGRFTLTATASSGDPLSVDSGNKLPFSSFVSDPFDFTWVSGIIPSDPLPAGQGLRMRVPASIVSSLPQILDPDSSTYDDDLASLVSGLETAASDGTLTDPAFEEWDTPVPPVSNTIANEPYSSLSGALSGISSFLGSISSSISQVAEAVISGDTGFFGNIVSALAVPFEPVFAIFRSGVGIWHYVVSWVGTISAPFSWSLSVLGGAGSYFLSPLYAAAAAAVVLAVYKKFGR